MRRWLFLLLMLWPVSVVAQSDDRSYLTAFLEDNLSDIGRTVTITGFTGALTSQASLTSMTIADANGVWLTLNGVTLDWNRAALFGGQVSINALTAQEIILARAPVPDPNALPSPEASGFSLPELPVSIDIGRIAADRIVLEAPVLGSTVEGTFEAAMVLSGGEGRANLTLDRTDDGPDGNIALTASYSNASRQLVIDLDATEAAGGIAATLLGLPGTPSASLKINGNGPINDFTAKIGLATDATDRLSGTIKLGEAEDGAMQFSADLAGDLAPLFVPEYATFFGSDVGLRATGSRAPDGRIALSDLAVKTRALALNGKVTLAPDGLPENFALTAALAMPDGSPVLLPLNGTQETRLNRADLALSFDAAKGDDWSLRGIMDGLDQPDLNIAHLALDGVGKISRSADGNFVDFNTTYRADGIAPTDPALAQALGSTISGSATGSWAGGTGALQLSRFDLAAQGLSLLAKGSMAGLASGFGIEGEAQANITQLDRFSALAGRPLAGSGTGRLAGKGSLLGGDFDITATINGQDLQIGQAEVDRLLTGKSQINLSVMRDKTGTTLRKLALNAATLTASAAGKIASTGSELGADLDFTDLSALGPQYKGALAAKATLTGTLKSGKMTLQGQANSLAIGQPEADTLLRGASTISIAASLKDGAVLVTDAKLNNPQITAEAKTTNGATSQIDLAAKLANLGLLLPEFPGAVTVAGTALNEPGGLRLNLRAQGPGQINATVAGLVAKGGTTDLAINGTGQAALANAFIEPQAISGALGFDLRLNGPLALSSLSGKISLDRGRITSPDLPFALQDAGISATLSGGQAQIAGQAGVSTGGTMTADGSIGLANPNTANLTLGLRDVVLRDPQLYAARASGNLAIRGPMTGGASITGQIDLRDTELRIPSSGLGGAEAIPDLRHVREPQPVRATRARAGLLGQTGGTDGRQQAQRSFGLDLTISAPNRVFLRGRGLDAELGGTVRLRGTTAKVVPDGNFDLIRGRLDILGKRLVLSEAQLRLEGDFLPFIRVVASNESDGVTSSVLIEGQANEPAVTFTSSPQLPQEEVLSRLLFGRGLETLSVFQAAQLAGAVASLAGKGGEGIVAKLRKGFGLDDLDIQTQEDGTASLRAGKYISRNIYSEVEVDQTGKSQIQLNLDVSDSVTLRGRVGSDGQTGLGVFLENDY